MAKHSRGIKSADYTPGVSWLLAKIAASGHRDAAGKTGYPKLYTYKAIYYQWLQTHTQ
ncbi:hypothetical protein [Chitinilyticum aquatile]|uniref:hypothetical protein n=1 Tax=Chitinilyticum aquatile TaxID=362520 RepID=UPI0012DC7616|nr:hypothetical protein [Chitinilyticum aquatile]